MTPYYEANGITIYHGDWRDARLPEKPALVLTDPPYGKNERTKRGAAGRGIHGPSRDFEAIAGDNHTFDPRPLLALETKTILWGANYYPTHLPATPSWIVWDKREYTASDDNADGEVAWSNLGGPMRIFRHLWRGTRPASEVGERVLHPSQKPVVLMQWCLLKAKLKPGALVFDPYMGSGPIAKACKALGYRYIGADVSRLYCATAATGLQQEVMKLVLADTEDLVAQEAVQ